MKKKVMMVLLAVMLLALVLSGCSGGEKKTNALAAIDLDLTQLSGTLVYSEVYNMMNTPEDYVGKVVKINGTAATFLDEETGQMYYSCMIADAAACCQNGLEFVLNEKEYSEEDYPSDGEIVEVTGEFETYEENGYTYCHLINSEMSEGAA